MKEKSIKLNVILRALVTIVEITSGLFSFPYIAKILNPQGLGEIDFVNSTVAYFIAVGSFGIAEFGAREVGQNRKHSHKLDTILSSYLAFRLVLALGLFFLYLILVAPYYGNGTPLFYLSSFLILSSSLNLVWALETLEDFGFIAVAKLLTKILFIVSLLVFVKTPENNLIYFIIMGVFDFIFFIASIFRLNSKFSISFRMTEFWTVMNFEKIKSLFQIFMVNLLQSSIAGIPAIILGKSGAFYELGLFSTAYRFLMMGFYAVVPLTAVFFSRSISFNTDKHCEHRQRHFDLTSNSLLLLSVPVSFGLFAISKDIIHLLVGPEYAGSALILKLLAPLILIFSFTNFWGMQVVFAFGKDRHLLKTNLIGLGIMVTMVLALAPVYGAIGAAIGYICGYSSLLGISYFYGRRYYNMDRVVGDGIKILVSAVLMLVTLTFVPGDTYLRLASKIVIGGAIYFGSLIISGHSMIKQLILLKIKQ